MNALARYNRNHSCRNNSFGLPTIFDLFSRPLADFNEMLPRSAVEDIKVDLQDKGDHYALQAEVPGFKKEDIKVDFDENVLTIKAERKQEKEEKNEQGYLVRERSYGSYSRAFRFEDADPSKINASLNDGVLNIDVMKAVKPETKTSIAIN